MSGARGRRGAEQGGSQGHRSRSRGTDRRSRPRPRAPLSSPGRGQREAGPAWGGGCGSLERRLAGPAARHSPHFLASPGSQQALGGVGEDSGGSSPGPQKALQVVWTTEYGVVWTTEYESSVFCDIRGRCHLGACNQWVIGIVLVCLNFWPPLLKPLAITTQALLSCCFTEIDSQELLWDVEPEHCLLHTH